MSETSEEERANELFLIEQEERNGKKPVLREQYRSDIEEILKQLHNLQRRLETLERREEKEK